MYVLKRNSVYVRKNGVDGFVMIEELDLAAMFHSIPELLQFVSMYIPKHCCGTYEIIKIIKVQQPSYVENKVVR